MTDFLINAENVVNTANWLVEDFFGKHYSQEKVPAGIELIFEVLKQALYNFKHPFEGRTPGEYSPMLLFDEHLTELLKSTKAMFETLTDENKKNLIDAVNAKQKEYQGYHRNFTTGKAEE